MQVVSFCNNIQLPPFGKEIGSGADGQVFEFGQNRVIKFSIIYQFYEQIDSIYEKLNNILYYIENTKPNVFVKVFEHKYLKKSYRDFLYDGINKEKQEYIIYYSIMEKLRKISDDEKKVFHTLVSHEDRGIIKDLSPSRIKKISYDLHRSLDFDLQRVILFCENIASSKILHEDLHIRNIMKDNSGSFKLIDLGRVSFKEE